MTAKNILAPLAAIAAPDAASLNTRAQSALAMVELMVIDSQETYELAADELKAIKTKAKTLEDQRTSITGPINKALKAVNDLFRAPGTYLEQAEKIIKAHESIPKKQTQIKEPKTPIPTKRCIRSCVPSRRPARRRSIAASATRSPSRA